MVKLTKFIMKTKIDILNKNEAKQTKPITKYKNDTIQTKTKSNKPL